jgi:hypothetical protein
MFISQMFLDQNNFFLLVTKRTIKGNYKNALAYPENGIFSFFVLLLWRQIERQPTSLAMKQQLFKMVNV